MAAAQRVLERDGINLPAAIKWFRQTLGEAGIEVAPGGGLRVKS